MTEHDIAERVAFGFLGKPYYWGGDDPLKGFDCSGFVIEILKSVGKLPRKGDWTAQGLFDLFHSTRCSDPARGRLVFWKTSSGSRMIHVEYCLDEVLSIGASGGGKSTDTQQAAINRNAYVKVIPFRSRNNIGGFVDPWG